MSAPWLGGVPRGGGGTTGQGEGSQSPESAQGWLCLFLPSPPSTAQFLPSTPCLAHMPGWGWAHTWRTDHGDRTGQLS